MAVRWIVLVGVLLILGCGPKSPPPPTAEEAAQQPPIEAPKGPEGSRSTSDM